ncbi:MAG: diaminopimelate epimerase [Thermodesulfobacteriota bacterium]|nr:diaminopimelate epimerase [Thermodesulfobacteriota bacterium]
MKFSKYHALGNDYIVVNPSDTAEELTIDEIRLICHRNYGIGSDGILFGPIETKECDFALRIFNPDGSEAEKSGNGLRIFSRYLWDNNLVSDKKFTVKTLGGEVSCKVHKRGEGVTVEMGKVSFDSRLIPVKGSHRDVINEKININGRELSFCAATIGNPHCVILCDEVSAEEAKQLGPIVEKEPRFPNKTNVQFMKIIDRGNIQIEIWERGAGYTLASGSSSSAAAAVAFRLGLCDSHIDVHMPGGKIEITVSKNFSILMRGPVTKIGDGIISDETFTQPLT